MDTVEQPGAVPPGSMPCGWDLISVPSSRTTIRRPADHHTAGRRPFQPDVPAVAGGPELGAAPPAARPCHAQRPRHGPRVPDALLPVGKPVPGA